MLDPNLVDMSKEDVPGVSEDTTKEASKEVSEAIPAEKRSRWTRFKDSMWDGPRSKEEKRLVKRLDVHLMMWATYGYFIRLLDSGNVTNAYVSGMKEDLRFHGNQFNLLQTFFICGYLVGQIPSQLLLTRLRPSYYLPTAELLWTVVTFCFAAVHKVEHVFALRFLIGALESPFAVGVLTLMGAWYTPRELAKRIAIFYSASYAAGMFSGYLQAAIYHNLNGHLGLEGWRWLFIFCGVISLPGAFFGYYAVPDNPYITRARWIKPHHRAAFIARVEGMDRRPPVRLSWAKTRKIVTHWPLYIMTLALMCVSTLHSFFHSDFPAFIVSLLSHSTISPSGSNLSTDSPYIRSTCFLPLHRHSLSSPPWPMVGFPTPWEVVVGHS